MHKYYYVLYNGTAVIFKINITIIMHILVVLNEVSSECITIKKGSKIHRSDKRLHGRMRYRVNAGECDIAI